MNLSCTLYKVSLSKKFRKVVIQNHFRTNKRQLKIINRQHVGIPNLLKSCLLDQITISSDNLPAMMAAGCGLEGDHLDPGPFLRVEQSVLHLVLKLKVPISSENCYNYSVLNDPCSPSRKSVIPTYSNSLPVIMYSHQLEFTIISEF